MLNAIVQFWTASLDFDGFALFQTVVFGVGGLRTGRLDFGIVHLILNACVCVWFAHCLLSCGFDIERNFYVSVRFRRVPSDNVRLVRV